MGLLGLMGLMVPGGFDGKVGHPFLFCIRTGIKIFFFVPANPKITEGPLSGCSLLLTSLAWPNSSICYVMSQNPRPTQTPTGPHIKDCAVLGEKEK